MYHNFIRNNPVLVSIFLFMTIFALIVMWKPGFLFKNDGSIREFGVGYRNKTILPIWLLAVILGILSYLFVLYYLAQRSLFR
jgi:hypothetical protein